MQYLAVGYAIRLKEREAENELETAYVLNPPA